MANKEQQIVGLTETLTEAQETLATTVAQNEQQQEVINTQDEMLNTGFYIVGDKKKLKDLGLLEGSLLSKKRLTSKGFSTKGFTKIDIRELHQLPTGSKKVDILSTHPTNSYEMSVRSDGTKVIVIKDPTEFWRHSRFLVVKTK